MLPQRGWCTQCFRFVGRAPSAPPAEPVDIYYSPCCLARYILYLTGYYSMLVTMKNVIHGMSRGWRGYIRSCISDQYIHESGVIQSRPTVTFMKAAIGEDTAMMTR